MHIVKPQTIKIRMFILVLFLQISTFTFSQTVSKDQIISKRISNGNLTCELYTSTHIIDFHHNSFFKLDRFIIRANHNYIKFDEIFV